MVSAVLYYLVLLTIVKIIASRKTGHRSQDAGEFFPLVFKSWLLTYAVKIGETEEILPQKNILSLQPMCIYGYIAISTNETSL